MTRRRRRPPGSTTRSGLGWEHQKARAAALAVFVDGTPCWRCRRPMYRGMRLQLDHTTPRALGGQGPRALVHGSCNEAAGARLGNQLRRLRRHGRVNGGTTGRRTDLPEW